MKNKIILAYSGGLDTSVILKWLVNLDYEVDPGLKNHKIELIFDMTYVYVAENSEEWSRFPIFNTSLDPK